MRLYFIVNEQAGNGQGAKKWRAIEGKLHAAYAVYKTAYAGHARQLASEIANEANRTGEQACIIAVGGDGTMNEIINGIGHQASVIVGNIAAGSGNDFSRAFKSFQTTQQIERYVKQPSYIEVDSGEVALAENTVRFMNNSGVGFDAFVAIATNESALKKKLNKFGLGKLCYVYYTIVGLFRFKPFHLTVHNGIEEQHFENVWFATVSNQPYFGGGMKLSPQSVMDDGQLELTIVHNLARWKFISVFGTVFFAKHTKFKEVKQAVSSEYTLKFELPQPMHTDGEKVDLQGTGHRLQFTARQKSWSLAKVK